MEYKNEQIIKKLKTLRKSKNLTVTELSWEARVQQTSIRRYENEEDASPNFSSLLRLINALDFDVVLVPKK